MTRKAVMAGNWKMNKTWAQAVVLAQSISNLSEKDWDALDVVLCPPMVDIKAVNSVLEFDNTPIALGAQNVHFEPEGAFTGETSVDMLKDVGASYCIIGHSERREYFAETDEAVNKKAAALLAGGLTPIICVGESLAIRDEGSYLEFVGNQVKAAFAGFEPAQVSKCIVAYEPIWAIGTGRTATPEQAEEVCAHIRSVIAELAGQETAVGIRVLYGGSMKPANVEGLMAQEDIDGGLIGGASLVAEDFADLVKACL